MLMFAPEGSSPLVSMFKQLKHSYDETFKFKPLLLCNLGLFFLSLDFLLNWVVDTPLSKFLSHELVVWKYWLGRQKTWKFFFFFFSFFTLIWRKWVFFTRYLGLNCNLMAVQRNRVKIKRKRRV